MFQEVVFAENSSNYQRVRANSYSQMFFLFIYHYPQQFHIITTLKWIRRDITILCYRVDLI